MIPAAPTPLQHSEPRRWQALWREAVRDPRELLALLGLESLAHGLSDAAAAQFPLRVPRGFVARMRPGDPADRCPIGPWTRRSEASPRLPDPTAQPARPDAEEVGCSKPLLQLALPNLPNLPDLYAHI